MAEHILIVDDHPQERELLAATLRPSGYELSLAEDGFEALLVVDERQPALVISDLNMPGMSGFELLSVLRRRYPEIPVICVSGQYGVAVPPPYVVCDAFLEKGKYKLGDLRTKVAELLLHKVRAPLPNSDGAVVWLPRGRGGYYIVTCTHCLRSFPVRSTTRDQHAEQRTSCIHCETALHYFIEGGDQEMAAAG